MGNHKTFVACALGLLVLAGQAGAQTFNAEVIGRVVDPQGAAVPRAEIKLIEVNRGTTMKTVSGDDGNYQIVGVPAGVYRLEASGSGFQTAIIPDFPLRSNIQKRVDVSLQVGQITERITVTEQAPAIETEKPTITATMPKEVLERPLTNDARGWVFQAMGWMPGSAAGSAGGGGWMIYGAGHADQQEFTLEGGSIDPDKNPLPEMSVSEVQVVTTNAPAEFARPVNMNVTFRSGGNQLHGAWEWTLKNPVLNAVKTPFYQGDRAPGTSIWFTLWRVGGPVYIPKVYDGRNKTFFHYTYHRNLDVIVASPGVYTAPSLEMQGGNFANFDKTIRDPLTGLTQETRTPFPNNTIPANRLSAVTKKWNDIAMAPGPGVSYLTPSSYQNNLVATSIYGGPWVTQVFKFDQNLGTRDVLSFGINRNQLTSWQNAPYAGVSARTFTRQSAPARNYNVAHTRTFGPTIVNELRFALHNNDLSRQPVLHDPVGPPPASGQSGKARLADLGIQGLDQAPDSPGAPQFSVTGWCCYNVYNANPQIDSKAFWQFYDNLFFKRGAHGFKAGWYSQRYWFDSVAAGPFWGQFGFDGRFSGEPFADYLLGYPGSFARQIPRPDVLRRLTELGAYFQDDWQVSSKLTLSLGIRWNTNTVPTEANGLYYNFDFDKFGIVVPDDAALGRISPAWPSQRLPVITAAQAGLPSNLFNMHHYFTPRVGFAWRPAGGNKTVIRGGYGVYTGRIWFDQLQTAGPFQVTETFENQMETTASGASVVKFAFPNPFQGAAGAPPAINTAAGFAVDYRMPTVQNVNLTFERMLAGNWGFRTSYILSRTTQMSYSRDRNQPHPSTVPFSQSQRPYPAWQTLRYAENGGNNVYHAMEFQVSHPFSSGLWIQFNYTYRHERSDVGHNGQVWNFGQIAPFIDNAYDRARDRGPSGLFSKHDFIANWVYELPVGRGKPLWGSMHARGIGGKILDAVLGGWATSGTFTIRSGLPFNPVFQGLDPANVNKFSGRPDAVSDCDATAGQDVHGRWFNPACFAVPQPGNFGNVGRNSLWGPAAWTVLFNPYKDFRLGFLGEQGKMQIGANIANLTNTPAYALPFADVRDPRAGRILGLQNVRQPFGDISGMRSVLLRAQIQF